MINKAELIAKYEELRDCLEDDRDKALESGFTLEASALTDLIMLARLIIMDLRNLEVRA
ncbi:hypothetical protein [Lacticaseibacillus parakribbianus]|uniref:hypothetical protein n=1 Tax=Lacticaseibacillus parakribbianus TaxID=2970927 RepID=UPI0021CB19B5|nr:hypothetical protein [Lacticaseibacillus parakribbianus]